MASTALYARRWRQIAARRQRNSPFTVRRNRLLATLRVEPLKDRRLLAVIEVTSLFDNLDVDRSVTLQVVGGGAAVLTARFRLNWPAKTLFSPSMTCLERIAFLMNKDSKKNQTLLLLIVPSAVAVLFGLWLMGVFG